MARRRPDRNRGILVAARPRAAAGHLARAPPPQVTGAFCTMKNRWVLFVPLAIMGLLFGAFIYRLVTPAETLIQSQWIDKPLPLYDLPPATAGVEIGSASWREGGWLKW